MPALALPYPEHLGPACGTHTLGCWLAVLHSDALSILHFPFGTTFHTICLHYGLPPFLVEDIKLLPPIMSIA